MFPDKYDQKMTDTILSKKTEIMDRSAEIVNLNVGGKTFTTTKHTLLSVSDTFFSVLLSGRIPSYKDQSGAIFIDRDPELFSIILNYLRTSKLFNVSENNVNILRHEAEFYGITPLVKQLTTYENLLSNPTCGGDILFQVCSDVPFIYRQLIVCLLYL